MSGEQLMGTSGRYPLSQCRKAYVQRDYSQGLPVRFQTKMPPELEGKLEPGILETTVTRLNELYLQGEKVGARSAGESLLGCFTCYLAHLCITQQYDRALGRVADFLKHQNETVYLPRNLFVTDPIERGLRVVEISILNEPAPPAGPGPATGVGLGTATGSSQPMPLQPPSNQPAQLRPYPVQPQPRST